jgi:hypothetical protein
LGNSGTNATNNFIGTTDAVDFVVRTNNVELARVLSTGNVGVGETNPVDRLQVSNGNTRIGEHTPYLIKALQEQQSQIELLKSENSNLKNNNEDLSNDIKTMKAQIDVINEQLTLNQKNNVV